MNSRALEQVHLLDDLLVGQVLPDDLVDPVDPGLDTDLHGNTTGGAHLEKHFSALQAHEGCVALPKNVELLLFQLPAELVDPIPSESERVILESEVCRAVLFLHGLDLTDDTVEAARPDLPLPDRGRTEGTLVWAASRRHDQAQVLRVVGSGVQQEGPVGDAELIQVRHERPGGVLLDDVAFPIEDAVYRSERNAVGDLENRLLAFADHPDVELRNLLQVIREEGDMGSTGHDPRVGADPAAELSHPNRGAHEGGPHGDADDIRLQVVDCLLESRPERVGERLEALHVLVVRRFLVSEVEIAVLVVLVALDNSYLVTMPLQVGPHGRELVGEVARPYAQEPEERRLNEKCFAHAADSPFSNDEVEDDGFGARSSKITGSGHVLKCVCKPTTRRPGSPYSRREPIGVTLARRSMNTSE